MPELDEEEFTELVDGHFPRVDLVGKAANGVHRFLIAKSAPGAFEADVVRDLIAKAEMSSKDVNDLPDSAFAHIEPGGEKDDEGKTKPRSLRHFPIHDESHTRNALSRAPQSPFGDKAMPKIKDAAKKFGIEVAKAAEDMDASTALADEPNPVDQPGSAEWESLDAATAMKWVGILSRAKNAVGLLRDREAAEVATGAEGADGDEVFDLEDACCAIDCAIDLLAPFAAGEQAEGDLLAEVSKAAWVLQNSVTLSTIEELAPVMKAGRVLSSQNESRIRDAMESLQTVLSTLPEPVAKEEEVVKEGALTETSTHDKEVTPDVNVSSLTHGDDKPNDGHEVTPTSNTHDVSPSSEVELNAGVAKAAGEPMMAVYSSSGKLLGAVDPTKIMELQDGGDGDGETEKAPEAPPTDLAPAPSGTVGLEPAAAGAVTKSTEEVVEAVIAKAIKEVADAKDAEHASVVKSLEDRIAALEAPAPSRVLVNGALPPTHLLRGMDQGGEPVSVAKAAELRERLETAPDTDSREAIAKEMNAEAVREWQRLRDNRYTPQPSQEN